LYVKLFFILSAVNSIEDTLEIVYYYWHNAVLVSRPVFCSLGLGTCGLDLGFGLEGSVLAVFDTDQ